MNNWLVSLSDCRDCLNVRCFSFYQVDDFSANSLILANQKTRIDLYISEINKQLLKVTNVFSGETYIEKFADITVTRTITMSAKVFIKNNA